MPKTKTTKKPVKKTAKKPVKKKPAAKPVKKVGKKEPVVAKPEPEKKAVEKKESNKYFEAVGRRKTSTARVRLFTRSKGEITVNQKPCDDYFPELSLRKIVRTPLEKLNCQDKFGVSIVVKGGGLTGQAEACRHGISRALVSLNPYFKKRLKKAGFLTRDPRMRERKKFGLKRARRAPQWSKR